jgi:hypothetical protein
MNGVGHALIRLCIHRPQVEPPSHLRPLHTRWAIALALLCSVRLLVLERHAVPRRHGLLLTLPIWQRARALQIHLVGALYSVLILAWVGMGLCISPLLPHGYSSTVTLALSGAFAGLIHVWTLEWVCVGSVRADTAAAAAAAAAGGGAGVGGHGAQRVPLVLEHTLAPVMLYSAAAKGDVDSALLVLSTVRETVLSVRATAWAAYIAATKGHIDTAEAILQLRPAAAHCALSRALGETVAHAAAGNGHIDLLAIMMKHHRVSPNVRRKQDGLSLLHIAVATKRRAVIEFLLCEGADICAPDGGGLTPLHVAATGGDASIVALLLTAGRNPWESGGGSRGGGHRMVNAKDWCEGNTPLHLAASRGHAAACAELLRAGAAPSPRGGVSLEITPLHLACCEFVFAPPPLPPHTHTPISL